MILVEGIPLISSERQLCFKKLSSLKHVMNSAQISMGDTLREAVIEKISTKQLVKFCPSYIDTK